MVLDDTKMPGKTLGIRRIQCGRRDLQPLKKAILNVAALLHCKYKNFIDASGKPFIYEKTLSSKLKCYKVRKIDKKEEASLLWLHEVNYPITIPRPLTDNPKWARLLHINDRPWLLYDYVSYPTKDTYRRV
jgi:hypothetical protein